jgi:predicted small metal-binding protein
MPKLIRCRDVGVDCDFEARGETEQEVMDQCAEHAKSAHGMEEIPPELAQKVRAAMRDEEIKTLRAG